MQGAVAWGLVYCLWTVGVFVSAVDQWRRRKRGPLRVTALLTVSLALRSAWMINHHDHQDENWYMRAVSRLSILLQFLVVSMLVFAWAKILAKTPHERRVQFWVFCTANVVGWVLTLAISAATTRDNWLFRVDLAVISSLYAVAAVALRVHTYQMQDHLERQSMLLHLDSLHLDKPSLAAAHNSRPAKIAEVRVKLRICSVGLVVCFCVRAFAFIWEAASDRSSWAPWGVPLVVYPYSFYQIPELLPDAIVVLCVTNYVRWSRMRGCSDWWGGEPRRDADLFDAGYTVLGVDTPDRSDHRSRSSLNSSVFEDSLHKPSDDLDPVDAETI